MYNIHYSLVSFPLPVMARPVLINQLFNSALLTLLSKSRKINHRILYQKHLNTSF